MKPKLNPWKEFSVWKEIKKEQLLKLVAQTYADITISKLDCLYIMVGPKSDNAHIIEIKEPDMSLSDDVLLQKQLQEMQFHITKLDDIPSMIPGEIIEPRRIKHDRSITRMHDYTSARMKANIAKYNNFKRIR